MGRRVKVWAALLLGTILCGLASAGDYHDGETLICSDCHIMHISDGAGRRSLQGDRSSAARSGVGLASGSSGPAVREGDGLRRRSINDRCLSCHDNTATATDVLGANMGRSPGDVRQAGFLNRLANPGQTAGGHTLDSLDTAPGSRPPWRPEDENGAGRGLSCTNCHSPHGNHGRQRAYRNLRSDAGHNQPGYGLVTYNDGRPGLNDLTRDVFERRARAYDESSVDFNEPDPADSAMARFCSGCHSLLHGPVGDRQTVGGASRGGAFTRFLRHPGAGVDIGAINGGAWSRLSVFASHGNRVKVMSEVGVWDPPGKDVSPTCISCHKAHGNGNAFGLIYRSGHGTLTENGDSAGKGLTDLCGQCHGGSGLWRP